MRLIVILISIFIVPFANAQHYNALNFNSDNNFAEAYVYTITQDESGYLWAGTSNGVYKYNGISFEHFTQKDSLANNFITASINHNGVTWFGHRSGDFSFNSKSGFENIKQSEEEFSSIVGFQVDSLDRLWAASYSNGIFLIDKYKEITQYKFEEDLTIHAFCFINKDKLLIASDDGVRICNINPDRIITINKHLVDIPKLKTPIIAKYSPNSFIVATEESGVFKLELSGDHVKVKKILSGAEIGDNIISSLKLDYQKNLWIGTFGGGLFHLPLGEIDENQALEIESLSVETSDNIKCIFQDRDENIWLGNYGTGITKVLKNPFQNKNLAEYNSGNSVLSITNSDSMRWFGTEKAILSFNKNNKLVNVFGEDRGLPKSEFSSLFSSEDGSLWVGTPLDGLYRKLPQSDNFTKINISKGLLENNITALAGTNEYVWVGTKKGLVRVNVLSEELKWFSIQNGGLPHNVVKDLFIDSENKVWVTTQSNTLCYIENEEIKKIEIPSYNGMFVLNSVTKDCDDNIWLASNGMGVFKVLGDSILNLREKEGLFSNYCYSVISDSKGFVWVSHRGGLSRIDTKNLAIRSVQKFAGIRQDEEFNPNASCLDYSGVLWFGKENGVLCYNPKLENSKFLAPILNLVSIRVNGAEEIIRDKIKLSSGKYKLKFEFVGISLKEPEEVKYQYRLVGYDNEWSEISYERSASFTNLTSGKYTFELNASSSDGVITKSPLVVEVIIKKPLWSYWWFYLVLISVLFGMGIVYTKRREYKLVQDKALLEHRVVERTREIQKQHDEIQRQGEIIHKKNIDITDSIKYARTIQSAIFPPEDILKSALPEYFLINKPKDIVSGDFCWYTKRGHKYVIAVTDCTGHGVPGAIMSMLGITLFNEVVNNLGITNSAEILEVVRDKVISALNQHRTENPSYDGMNVGLCVLDTKKKQMQYSGAFHNLVHFHKKELQVVKAERTPIGYSPLGKPPFKTHNIEYDSGDMFYLYSDGIQDQFGGEDDRKFTNRRLLNILSDVQDKKLDDQKLVVEQTLAYWMQDEEQTDDVIMLGFRM